MVTGETPNAALLPPEATEFQTESLQRTTSLLSSCALPFRVEPVQGREELYVVIRILSRVASEALEVYVYQDELGFFHGENWVICETPDYPDSQALIDAFLQRLRAVISDGEAQVSGVAT